MLVASQPDDIGLTEAVRIRFNELIPLHRQKKGTDLIVPPDLAQEYRRVIDLCRRHHRGDFRHSPDELKALKQFAQWTLDINCDLRGQERKVLECLKAS